MSQLASFGPYVLHRAIAANPIAVSFAASYQPVEGTKLVAFKVFRDEATMHPPVVDALVDEATRVARLNHVNIANAFDLCAHEASWYAVSEFVDGLPLIALLAAAGGGQRTLTTEVSAFLCAEVAAGLGYAHARKDPRGQSLDIVHAGIGPHCVMLSRTGIVKVADFGLSRAMLLTGLLDRAQPFRLQFTAPEVVRGDAFDARADLFSLGALAHLMLTGRTIYAGKTGDALRTHAERGYVPPAAQTDPALPPALAAILDRALQPDPTDRFEDATVMREALGDWLRIEAPGFGRHRLRNYMERLLPQSTYDLLPETPWTPLHRKDFAPRDAASVIHEAPTPWPGETGERPPLAPLLVDPKLPNLGELDLSQMVTGAHPAIRSGGSALAEAVRGSARPISASVRAVPETAAKPSEPDATPEPEPTPTPESPPEPTIVEAPIDYDALAAETYDDTVDADALARAARDELRATRRPQRNGPLLAVLGLMLLAGAAYGAWMALESAREETAGVQTGNAPVFITSRPQGATVFMDGEPSEHTTPVALPAEQRVQIHVELVGYAASAAQPLVPGETRALSFELEPAP
jgi:serine/threonine protein kinase